MGSLRTQASPFASAWPSLPHQQPLAPPGDQAPPRDSQTDGESRLTRPSPRLTAPAHYAPQTCPLRACACASPCCSPSTPRSRPSSCRWWSCARHPCTVTASPPCSRRPKVSARPLIVQQIVPPPHPPGRDCTMHRGQPRGDWGGGSHPPRPSLSHLPPSRADLL